MKVKEFIKILQQLDQERNLVTILVGENGEVIKNDINNIHEDSDGLYHIY